MTSIVTSDYPIKICFETNVSLPDFRSSCKVRTDMLHNELRKLKYNHAFHDIEDFIIEMVETKNRKEFWHIGS
jgi:hypothetical protein